MTDIHDLPTPALLLDLDAFESNLEKMSVFVRERGVALRPHAKTHKCVEIARRQLAQGAIGISVATLAEAELMTGAGIRGLLITAEIVGKQKVARLMQLMSRAADTRVVVDNTDNVDELQQAAGSAGVQIPVLIDLDVGQDRTGIHPGDDALQLARHIAQAGNLELNGLCAYAGHVAHVVGFADRAASSHGAMARAVETRDLLAEDGHNMGILSGASTGTYNIDPDIEGFTELQAGSYVFMDVDYRRIGGRHAAVYDDFSPALTVLATVIHRSGDKAVVDAGLKAFATDRAFGPEPLGLSGVRYEFAGDEHGRLRLENPSQDVQLGDQLRFIIPHCDPTVNLFDRIHCVRGDTVEDEWSIMARGSGPGYF
jgi:3-hydroxy-D-aspartate aldolase